MLSHLHATLSEMFRHRPGLAAELLSDVLGVSLPLRPDDAKRWTWPLYATTIRRQCRGPTLLLVVCPTAATARWAATPIDLGNASFFRPAVLGLDLMPLVTDPAAAARAPELAVLSALAHAEDPNALTTLDVLAGALTTLSVELAVDYASLVLEALPERARAHLEELLTTQPHIYDSYLARRFRAEGEAQGRAAILLRILERRGVTVTDDARVRVTACSDLRQLELWSDRALTATTIEDVFTQP